MVYMYLYLMIEQLSLMTQAEIREEIGKSERYIHGYSMSFQDYSISNILAHH